jgi:hypothetical protein
MCVAIGYTWVKLISSLSQVEAIMPGNRHTGLLKKSKFAVLACRLGGFPALFYAAPTVGRDRMHGLVEKIEQSLLHSYFSILEGGF